ncbi:MAG TPA: ABC transporter ATP-binding protein [Acidimicrobiia bacterium]|nr:ABC transporter ATP-binding protein [Acidimicrobiia bacterium]
METTVHPSAARPDPLLSVHDLRVDFKTEEGVIHAVRGVSWEVYPGEVLGIVGESGSGKSVSVAAVLGLLPSQSATVTGGPVLFGGRNLLTMSERELRKVRGKEIAMIFQDPMTAFNPVQTIGHQLSEALRVHDRSMSRRSAKITSTDLLALVGVPSPAERFSQFPHEYSGGMRQRAMIAMAIANRPKILIADEPTTALDVTIQAQILELLEVVRKETNAATILITHDLGVIAEVADRVLVMYAGKVVESTSILRLFQDPRHPYTLGLMGSLPRLDVRMEQLYSIPGQPPNLNFLPQGCAFAPRCSLGRGRSLCRQVEPALVEVDAQQAAACHFTTEMETEARAVSERVGIDVRAGRE